VLTSKPTHKTKEKGKNKIVGPKRKIGGNPESKWNTISDSKAIITFTFHFTAKIRFYNSLSSATIQQHTSRI
jgi:hypothetical protein